MNLSGYTKRHKTVKGFKLTWGMKKMKKYLRADSRFLDVGCAFGFMNLFIKNKKNYHGVDYNNIYVTDCKKRGLQAKQHDLGSQKLPYKDNSMDIIWCSHVLEHLDVNEQLFAMKEFKRVLKKGGHMFIFSPTPFNWFFWDDETHKRPCTHWSLTHLAHDFNLKVVEARYTQSRYFPNSVQKYFRIPPIHLFLSSVYLIATKE